MLQLPGCHFPGCRLFSFWDSFPCGAFLGASEQAVRVDGPVSQVEFHSRVSFDLCYLFFFYISDIPDLFADKTLQEHLDNLVSWSGIIIFLHSYLQVNQCKVVTLGNPKRNILVWIQYNFLGCLKDDWTTNQQIVTLVLTLFILTSRKHLIQCHTARYYTSLSCQNMGSRALYSRLYFSGSRHSSEEGNRKCTWC